MIIYFSGTGNSRYIGKKMAEALQDPTIDLKEQLKSESDTCQADGMATAANLIIVAPVYAYRLPRVVYDWIMKTDFPKAKRIWFVINCGSDIGNAAKYTHQLAEAKGLEYMGTAEIIMPENYIAMYHAPEADEARQIVADAEPHIDEVIECIRDGCPVREPEVNTADRLKSGIINPAFYKICVSAKAFRAEDSCVGCGKCEQVCPMGNVTLDQKSRPVWGSKCTHCMACICYCPVEAIQYGRSSKGKRRYTFEGL